MKIYTKQGDLGQTGLFGGPRVPKDHPRISAYGTLDELNSTLGVVLAEPVLPPSFGARLERIQSDLFSLGAELATPSDKGASPDWISDTEVSQLEKEIDEMEATLEPLTSFILPSGVRAAALLQVSRTICRRAEREAVSLHASIPQRPVVVRFLNRLSDYLFVASRFVNHELGGKEQVWLPASKRG